MRTCARCQASTPSGLRFCNYCGARLQDAAAADLVFGNLALDLASVSTPEESERPQAFQPPRNLRAPSRREDSPLSKAREMARSLAQNLPGQAMGLASAAGRLAARTANRVADAVAGQLPDRVGEAEELPRLRVLPGEIAPQTAPGTLPPAPQPIPTNRARTAPGGPRSEPVAPPAISRGELGQLHPDLQAAYQTYLEGREAYARGDRKLAARLFVGALRQSPPDSPLGEFLRRVLRPRKEGNTSQTAPTAPTAQAAAPAPARTPASPTRAAAPAPATPRHAPGPMDPRSARSTPSSLRHPSEGPQGPTRQGLRVLSGGLDVARTAPPEARTPVGVATPRPGKQDVEQRRRRARKQAQELWFRNLPTTSPNRPSFLLDEADGGRDLERVAGATLAFSAVSFLLLLFL